jgi:hypothetical protein
VYVIQRSWEQQLAAATYFSSVVDWATLDFLRKDQDTTWKTGFGNGRRSPLVTGNAPVIDQVLQISQRKVTGRWPLLITLIRNGHQTTTITSTSHRSCENDCFFRPTGNFGNRHQNKARYCEINIRDACGEPASPMSQRTGHVLVTGFYGARYFIVKFVTGVPIEAHYSVVSVCNEL